MFAVTAAPRLNLSGELVVGTSRAEIYPVGRRAPGNAGQGTTRLLGYADSKMIPSASVFSGCCRRTVHGVVTLLLGLSAAVPARAEPESPPRSEKKHLVDAEAPDDEAELALEPDATGRPAGSGTASGKFDDIDLQDLLNLNVNVISSTKTAQRAEQAPSIVVVITAKDIRQRGYRTVGDALRHVPGLTVIYDHVSYDVGVRGSHSSPGASNEIIKFMLNGQPIAFRSTGSSSIGYDFIPIEAVRQIEVLRSPGSALYGANAFLGVVNVITYQRGTEDEPLDLHLAGVETYLSHNPQATTPNGTVSFASGRDIGRFHYFASGVFHTADRSGLIVPGYTNIVAARVLPPSNRSRVELGYPSPGWNLEHRRYLLEHGVSKNDTERAASFYHILSYDLNRDLQLKLDLHTQFIEQGAEFIYYAPLTHDTRLTSLSGFGRLMLVYGQDKRSGFSGQLAFVHATGLPTKADRISDRAVPGTYIRRRFGFRAYDLTGEVSYAFSAGGATSPDTQAPAKLTLGLDASSDHERLMALDTVDAETGRTLEQQAQETQNFTNLGTYLQLLWSPLESLNTTLGARIDHNTEIACDDTEWDCFAGREDETLSYRGRDVVLHDQGLLQLSNRAAVVYGLPWLGMFSKAIYSSSFKPPSPFQLRHAPLTQEGSTEGEPALKPQTADTLEVQVGAQPATSLYVALTGFYSSLANTVRYYQEGPVLRARNTDIELLGMEAETRWALSAANAVFFANASLLAHQRLRPQQLRSESDVAWRYSEFNTVVDVDRYPRVMANLGANFQPRSLFNLNLLARIVGPRSASLSNTKLFNWNSLKSTYELDPYVSFDLTASTVNLALVPGAGETIFSVGVRGLGVYEEPGFSGIDLPSPGPQFFTHLEQRL